MLRDARQHLQQRDGAVNGAHAVHELLLQLRYVSFRGTPWPTLVGLRKRKPPATFFPW